jgi:hypothetical protein
MFYKKRSNWPAHGLVSGPKVNHGHYPDPKLRPEMDHSEARDRVTDSITGSLLAVSPSVLYFCAISRVRLQRKLGEA